MTPTTTKLIKRTLFRVLGYTPHPVQLEIHRSRAQRRVVACGVRFGKSTAAAMEAVAALLQPCDSKLGWLVSTQYDATDRIFKHVVRVLTTKFAHRVLVNSPREHRIVVTNLGGGTSELKAKSADRPDGLLGEALDFLIVDEAASLKASVWQECLAARVLDRKGWCLLIGTPKGTNWFFDEFERGETDVAYQCWQAPTLANPHVDRAAIEAERARLTPELFAQQYEASFLGAPKKPCKLCGGPREDVSGEMTMPKGQSNESYEPPRCPACRMIVDEAGRCLVRRHNQWFASYQVDSHEHDYPSMSFYSWHTDGVDVHNWR
jgi:hypothetical protein